MVTSRRDGWLALYDRDLGMIGGVLLISLGLGTVANARHGWFAAVIWVDFWLIAYPHVGSMWTRIVYDRESARRHVVLWAALPPLVLMATASLAHFGGALVLNTLYWHWQTFHYTRQSYGIARAYRWAGVGAGPSDRPAGPPSGRLTDAVVFAFPIWGWLHRSAQGSTNFFGGPLWLPTVPDALANGAGGLAIGLLVAWCWSARRLSAREVAFVVSHVLVTYLSYVAVSEITRGWIFVNIWHNAQYILFVWVRNTERFEGFTAARPPSVAWLCQPRSWIAYAAVVLGASTIGFALLGATVDGLAPWAGGAGLIGAGLVMHQSLNFHHYIVDAVIWRRAGSGWLGRRAGAPPFGRSSPASG